MRFVAVWLCDVWLHPGFYFNKDEHDEQRSEQPPDGEIRFHEGNCSGKHAKKGDLETLISEDRPLS